MTKIKEFKIFKGKKINAKLCAISLSGIIAMTSLTGCSSKNTENNEQMSNIEMKTILNPGEHIISIPIENPTKEIKIHDYYEGYKCVGMGTSAYGGISGYHGGSCLLYVNEYAVECTASIVDGKFIYNNFGSPIDFEKNESVPFSDGFQIYEEGEHIISIPIDDPTDANVQYQYYEGYETVDIAFSNYGETFGYYSGGAILYVNTVPVKCRIDYYDENNKPKCLSFGTPIEEELRLTKSSD